MDTKDNEPQAFGLDALFSSARVVHRRHFLAAAAGTAATGMLGGEALAKSAKAEAPAPIEQPTQPEPAADDRQMRLQVRRHAMNAARLA